jgi:DNA primase
MKKGKLSTDLLRKIKDSVNILEVVGEHVVLKKSGANYVGLCPFHSERSPSFSVSENKQLYHCYGCKKGGDLVSFVMEIQGLSFPETIEELSERAKIQLPKEWDGESQANPEYTAKREKTALAYKLNRFAAAYFHQSLAQSEKVQEYYTARGVNSELIKSFYLGSAPESWDSLTQYLVSKKAPLDLAVELGLIRPSTKSPRAAQGAGYFDLFRNRTVFPIVNLRGKVAGFGGRVLGEDSPKYLNSPDSSIFQKGKLAFGLFQAQKYIRENDAIILVEGYFDVLAMHAAGFRNVVATCGTALTLEHLSIFQRLASRIILLFDGDNAGIAATSKSMEIGLEQGLILYGAQPPEGMDPDEILFDLSSGKVKSDGIQQMTTLLQEARPLLDKKLEEQVLLSHKSPEDRTQALKKMGGWLARFKDPVGRDVRVQWIEKKLGIPHRMIQDAMYRTEAGTAMSGKSAEQHRVQREVKRPGEVPAQGQRNSTLTAFDRMLLGGLIFGGEYSKVFFEEKPQLPPHIGIEDLFDHPAARKFVSRVISEAGFLDQLRSIPDSLVEGGEDSQVSSVLTESLLWTEPPFSVTDFRRAISKGVVKLWARFSQWIKTAIAEAELNKDAELQAQLMKEYLDVQRKMKDFSSFYDQE